MIRIYEDTAAGRAAIARKAGLENTPLPPAVLERNRSIFGEPLEAEAAVARIVDDVRLEGDEAVRRYTALIDGVELEEFFVDPSELNDALRRIPPAVRRALELAAGRIRAFHAKQNRKSWIDWDEGGLGQLVRPLERVACYVPGGTAPYPSTVLMTAIPAQVAGVPEIVVATPPGRDGRIADVISAACGVAGVSKVLKVGGAQAIAALAFGTSTIPRVDKIVGPGNLFVTLAKKRVFGSVGIDALHGPTETMLIADGHASPVYCAADMLAQAEHDPQASSILLTTSRELAVAVAEAIEQQLGPLERGAVARASIEANGAIVVVSDLNTAVDIANEYAPEHLCLLVEDPFRLLPLVKNAGGVFLGESSFEVMGDYVAGPSHTMPTGGTARFSSALNVDDFVKTTSVVALDEAVMRQLGEAAALLARSEGLTAHAHAVDVRMQAAEHARVVRRAGGQ